MHSEHVQTPLVELVERTHSLQRRRDGDVSEFGELSEELRSFGSGEHSLTGVDDGSLGVGDEGGGALEGDGGGSGSVRARSRDDSSEGREIGSGRVGMGPSSGDGGAEDSSGDILGEIDENGYGSTTRGNLERFINSSRELGDVLDHDVPLGTAPRDTDDISLLESVGSDRGRCDLATEDHHRRSVGEGVLHRGDDIRRSWSTRDENDSGLSGNSSVSFGHVPSALLVAGKDKVEVLRVVDGVEDGENRSSWVPKDLVDFVSEHHFVEDLSSGEADEGGIHVIGGGLAGEGRGAGVVGGRGRRGLERESGCFSTVARRASAVILVSSRRSAVVVAAREACGVVEVRFQERGFPGT